MALEELKSLTQTFVTANTPNYLWKRLRADESLRVFSEKLTDEEIINWFFEHRRSNGNRIVDLETACILVVAVSFRSFESIQNILHNIDLSGCEWAVFLRQKIHQTMVPVAIHHLDISPPIVKSVRSVLTEVETSYSKLVVTP